MGPLGYQSDAQASLKVSFNGLASYARSLQRAMTEPYPAYEAIGLRNGDDYLQLATTLLQIENEFYGTIRPKRRIRRSERPLHALTERGVEYVEVRSLDVDPYRPSASAPTMHFLDAFLLHCLLSDSPPDTPDEIAEIAATSTASPNGVAKWVCASAARPRTRPSRLGRRGHRRLRAVRGGTRCRHRRERPGDALAAARAALADPAKTPSARVLGEIEQDFGNSYFDFALARSLQKRGEMLALPSSAEQDARYRRMADESLAAQREIEASDPLPFETYRRQYLAQDLLAGMQLPVETALPAPGSRRNRRRLRQVKCPGSRRAYNPAILADPRAENDRNDTFQGPRGRTRRSARPAQRSAA